MKKLYILLLACILFLPCFVKAQLFDPTYHIGRHRMRALLKEGFKVGGVKVDTIVADSIYHKRGWKYCFKNGHRLKYIMEPDTIERDTISGDILLKERVALQRFYETNTGKWINKDSTCINPSTQKGTSNYGLTVISGKKIKNQIIDTLYNLSYNNVRKGDVITKQYYDANAHSPHRGLDRNFLHRGDVILWKKHGIKNDTASFKIASGRHKGFLGLGKGYKLSGYLLNQNPQTLTKIRVKYKDIGFKQDILKNSSGKSDSPKIKLIVYRNLIRKDATDTHKGCWAVSSGSVSPMRFYELNPGKTGLFRETKSPRNDDSTNLNYIYSNDSISLAINPNQFIKINSFSWFVSVISLAYRTAPYHLRGYSIAGAGTNTPAYIANTQGTANLTDYRWQEMGTAGALGPFSLGPVFGLTWSNNCLGPQVNQSEWALSLGLGCPVTVTQLAKEPVKNLQVIGAPIPSKKTPTYDSIVTYSPSASSFGSVISNIYISPSFVFGISTHNIGIVITYGWNYMFGAYRTNWLYYGRPTIGIGLGVTIAGGSGGSSGTGH